MPNKFPMPVETLVQTMDELLSHQGQESLAQLLRQSDADVSWQTQDNFDGGIDYYTLNLRVPIEAFATIESTRTKIEKKLLEKVEAITRQYEGCKISRIVIVPDKKLSLRRSVPQTAIKRIWKEGFRLFLSHKAEVKVETAELRDTLKYFGISAFVAHSDIHPTKAWQEEIENALSTMDGFAALMTENFHDSDWTDQEVGYALALGVPMIAVRFGRDPYGFIGKFQALSCSWKDAPKEIVRLLINHERMLNAYIKAVQNCIQFDIGNKLATVLPHIDKLTDEQADALISAYNNNIEVGGSFGFNGAKPRLYGDGLLSHLKRLNGRKYRVINGSGNIKVGR